MLKPEDCKPGTLVECIASTEGLPTVLRLGGVYRIEKLVIADTARDGNPLPPHPTIWLEGIWDRYGASGRYSYGLKNFRLLPDERIAIFRAMLQPIREDA